MRHVDSLEEQLGTRLFIRNDKGYIATEAGEQILRLGDVTEQQFHSLSSQLSMGQEQLEGRLTITSLDEALPVLLPVIDEYMQGYARSYVSWIWRWVFIFYQGQGTGAMARFS